MTFSEIENKEKYFIQPYIEGEKCNIFIGKAKAVFIKCINKTKKVIKIPSRIKKQLKTSYEASKYNGTDIVLKGFFITDLKNRTTLMLYDILLKTEYEKKIQSKKYNVRYENLMYRFLLPKSSEIKIMFSYPYSEYFLDVFIKLFVNTNKVDKILFRKNIPYKYEDDDIIIEDIWTSFKGKVVNIEEGSFVKQETNDKQEVVQETTIRCAKSLFIETENDTIKIDLDYLSRNDAVEILNSSDAYINHSCIFKQYAILNKMGYIFDHILTEE